jgi:NAD(P)H-hydrate epimerase
MLIKNLLPKRTKLSNKTDGGKVMIIGGGKGLYGAGLMSGLAATKCGAGYTHLMTDLTKFPWFKCPDFILHPLKLNELKQKQDFCIGIGPGLGTQKAKLNFLKYLLKNNFEKVIADADALTLIAAHHLAPLPSTWILTPHEGELARLVNQKASKVKSHRKEMLQMAGEMYQCVVLLKGHETLVFSPESKKISSIKTNAVSLSKAGTGDVLLGMLAAFRAQGLGPKKACLLAVTLHGKVASRWENEGHDYLSLRPMDIIERLPQTIYQLRKS